MSECGYIPVISADFGKAITRDEINNEFQAIEEALQCVQENIENISHTVVNIINHGSVTERIYIDSGGGLIQYMTVEDNVEIIINEPEVDDPRLITLVIADGAEGFFNFPEGMTWTSNAHGDGIDGKPWDTQGLAGDYGALVVCIYDGYGWIQMVYARHDIDYTAPADVDDIYRYR